jgi:hypothetical protein
MDKSKLGATGKSGGEKKADQASTLPKLPFSYNVVKARCIQKWIIDLQSVLFNEQNKNKIMRYLIDEEQIKLYSLQVKKDKITHMN